VAGLELVAQLANLAHQFALLVPALLQVFSVSAAFSDLRGNLGQLLLVVRADNFFALQDPLLHFERVDLAGQVFNRRRRRVLAQREASARRVEDAHRLVGQLASGKEAVRETDAGMRPLRPGCEPCDAFQARPPGRAS
jgi:hypothetical protein